MTARLVETQLWQQNLASLIRAGLFSKAATGKANGLFTVVGIYKDETCSAPLAKYSDSKRAANAANLVNRIALVQGPVESNRSESQSGNVPDHGRPQDAGSRPWFFLSAFRVWGRAAAIPGDPDEPSACAGRRRNFG
jgi:hypothetical protein